MCWAYWIQSLSEEALKSLYLTSITCFSAFSVAIRFVIKFKRSKRRLKWVASLRELLDDSKLKSTQFSKTSQSADQGVSYVQACCDHHSHAKINKEHAFGIKQLFMTRLSTKERRKKEEEKKNSYWILHVLVRKNSHYLDWFVSPGRHRCDGHGHYE